MDTFTSIIETIIKILTFLQKLFGKKSTDA